MKSPLNTLMLFAGVLVLTTCASGERVGAPVPLSARSPRDAYALQLERLNNAVARAWEDAGRRALRAGLSVTPEFRERVHFPAEEPHAIAYRFPLRRGQSLHVNIDAVNTTSALFAEVFEVITEDMYRHVYSPASPGSRFSFRARANALYVLRLQPAPGAAGTHDVHVVGDRSIIFPLPGYDMGAIRSWLGDPRDGGTRLHEGVDIFAPRGTPVIAVADGRVTSVRPTPVGGNVIWQDDVSGNVTYYYAHLHRVYMYEGQQVSAGDTIGSVGNTGNAITTSPHLHFGVYLPGRIPLDPSPMFGAAHAIPVAFVDPTAIGRWARVIGEHVWLRGSPSHDGVTITELPARTPLYVLGGVGAWNRVVLNDGSSGFIAASAMDAASTAGSR